MAPFSRFEEEAAEVLPDKLRLVYPIPKWPGGEDFSPGVPFEFLCDSEPFREQAGFLFRHMSKGFRGGGGGGGGGGDCRIEFGGPFPVFPALV